MKSANSSRGNQKHRKAVGIGAFVGIIAVGILYAVLIIPNANTISQLMAHGDQVAEHSHIYLKSNIDIPQGIGIKAELWNDHTLDGYGVSGYAPLHTHGADGTIHLETNEAHAFTLGDFMAIWGHELPTKVFRNGGQIADPENLQLKDGMILELVFDK